MTGSTATEIPRSWNKRCAKRQRRERRKFERPGLIVHRRGGLKPQSPECAGSFVIQSIAGLLAVRVHIAHCQHADAVLSDVQTDL